MRIGLPGFLAMLVTLLSSGLHAHDIGITQAELIELDGDRYQFSARFGSGAAMRHPPPEFPERCAFSGSPAGVQTPSARVWEIACNGRLTADDAIVLRWLRDGAMVAAEWRDGSTARRLFGNERGAITVELSELQAGSRSTVDAIGRYTVLGVEHILEGIDHLLFVLGLLLIVSTPSVRVVPLIQTVTAFTVAHSLTLGLATLGFVSFPSRPVEAAIALSIVFLAMEVVRGWQGQQSLTHRQPWLVAFGFGLLHGVRVCRRVGGCGPAAGGDSGRTALFQRGCGARPAAVRSRGAGRALAAAASADALACLGCLRAGLPDWRDRCILGNRKGRLDDGPRMTIAGAQWR